VIACLTTSSPIVDAHPLDRRELEARKSFAEAHYEDALHIFADLFAQFGDPIYLRNIARCYQKMKRPAEAIATFQEYLAKAKVSPEERQQISGYISEMESLQAAPPRPGPGVDERDAVPPTSAVTSAAPPPSPAVVTNPEPLVASRRPEPLVVVDQSKQSRRILKWAGLGTGAAGVVLLGLGLGFGLSARAAAEDVQFQYIPARDDDGRRDAHRQWIAYGVGGSALVVGAILFAFSLRDPVTSPERGLRGSVGPAGVALEGDF
jgi:hypothetical protein